MGFQLKVKDEILRLLTPSNMRSNHMCMIQREYLRPKPFKKIVRKNRIYKTKKNVRKSSKGFEDLKEEF